jgi:hypothetical protein
MANEHSYKGGVLANGDGYIAEKVNANGSIYYFGDAVLGYNGIDVKFLGTSALNYLLWDESANYLLATRTIASLTGTDRFVVADQTLSGSITTLSTTAFRAHTQMGTSAIGGGAYVYGAQHKLTLGTSTINHADSRLCASLIQMDISGASTYTAGQLSALWIDLGGTSGMTNNGGQFNIVRISNTTVAVPTSVIFIYAEASYLFDLAGGPGGNADWFTTTSGGGATRKFKIAVKGPDGAACYLSLYTD